MNQMTDAMTRKNLLCKLQRLDFAIIETGLYLDSHPDEQKPLAYYHKLHEERKQAMEQYEAAFGPLTIFANHSKTDWQWVKGPWPWEMED